MAKKPKYDRFEDSDEFKQLTSADQEFMRHMRTTFEERVAAGDLDEDHAEQCEEHMHAAVFDFSGNQIYGSDMPDFVKDAIRKLIGADSKDSGPEYTLQQMHRCIVSATGLAFENARTTFRYAVEQEASVTNATLKQTLTMHIMCDEMLAARMIEQATFNESVRDLSADSITEKEMEELADRSWETCTTRIRELARSAVTASIKDRLSMVVASQKRAREEHDGIMSMLNDAGLGEMLKGPDPDGISECDGCDDPDHDDDDD